MSGRGTVQMSWNSVGLVPNRLFCHTCWWINLWPDAFSAGLLVTVGLVLRSEASGVKLPRSWKFTLLTRCCYTVSLIIVQYEQNLCVGIKPSCVVTDRPSSMWKLNRVTVLSPDGGLVLLFYHIYHQIYCLFHFTHRLHIFRRGADSAVIQVSKCDFDFQRFCLSASPILFSHGWEKLVLIRKDCICFRLDGYEVFNPVREKLTQRFFLKIPAPLGCLFQKRGRCWWCSRCVPDTLPLGGQLFSDSSISTEFLSHDSVYCIWWCGLFLGCVLVVVRAANFTSSPWTFSGEKVNLQPQLSDKEPTGAFTELWLEPPPLDIISYFGASVISKRKLPSSSRKINMVIRPGAQKSAFAHYDWIILDALDVSHQEGDGVRGTWKAFLIKASEGRWHTEMRSPLQPVSSFPLTLAALSHFLMMPKIPHPPPTPHPLVFWNNPSPGPAPPLCSTWSVQLWWCILYLKAASAMGN